MLLLTLTQTFTLCHLALHAGLPVPGESYACKLRFSESDSVPLLHTVTLPKAQVQLRIVSTHPLDKCDPGASPRAVVTNPP